MLISALKQTSPERFTVLFDDGSEVKTTLTVVTDMRLFTGKELDGGELTELRDASALSLCKARALNMVAKRAMSRKELVDKLTEKGEDVTYAEACAEWMVSAGFINDCEYAGMVVRHYAAKGYGMGRIRTELIRRGISRELWDEALSEMPEQDDTLDRLLRQRLRGSFDRADVKKASDALVRKGYGYDEISAALRRLRVEAEDGLD